MDGRMDGRTDGQVGRLWGKGNSYVKRTNPPFLTWTLMDRFQHIPAASN